MKTGVLKALGILMILVGAIGTLLVFRGGVSFSGFAIEQASFIEFSEINDIILRGGDKKTINLNVKNTNRHLTGCRLTLKGPAEPWIYSTETKDLAPNEQTTFTFDINIPDKTTAGEYLSEIDFLCNEKSQTIKFNIAVIKGVKAIEIKGIKSYKDVIELEYVFDNSGFIGDSTYVEVWIKNPDGFEIKRVTDEFSIKTDDLITRNLVIQLPEKKFGTYEVYFSHPSDPENYIKKLVVMGQPVATGKAIFKIVEGKGTPYIIFLIIIGLGVYLIFKSHRKSLQEMHEDERP